LSGPVLFFTIAFFSFETPKPEVLDVSALVKICGDGFIPIPENWPVENLNWKIGF
jgi:hypothetical protein